MVTRRDFLQTVAVGFVCGTLGSSFARGQKKRDSRYNVILLIADDMNDYGFYRTYPGVKTPYLENEPRR